MRILLDTNIFIYREDDCVLTDNMQKLLLTFQKIKAEIMIHPLSIEELKKDKNKERQKISLSKIRTYSMLELPPNPSADHEYLGALGPLSEIDDAILYAIFKDSVDFLITEDRGIHKKASRLGINDRVFLIDEALPVIETYAHKEKVISPPALKEEFAYNLNSDDPIFGTLKGEYDEFKEWFQKIKREGRKCWVHYRDDGSIGAVLIYKFEDEAIDSTPPFPKNKRIKIATLKVTHVGRKIGELFIKLTTDLAINNDINEIYLTHFPEPDDRLVQLITEYGFYKAAVNKRGEDIFFKDLIVKGDTKDLSPLEISKKYHPTFYDGNSVKKFIIPIKPEYHNRLFTDCHGRQTKFTEHGGAFIVEGNTIKKAYLTHSRIKKINPSDIVLFYKSGDQKRSKNQSKITSIGVVESINLGIEDPEEIMIIVGKRTVYSRGEIEEYAQKPTTVILFLHHFHLKNPLHLDELKEIGVLASAPQSIVEISDEKYHKIIKGGQIDERFTVN